MVTFEKHETSLQPVLSKRQQLQIVIMATGAFAVPSIRALYESGRFEIVCLVTCPLRYDKYGNPMTTPARQAAEKYGIPISAHSNVNSAEFFEFLYLVRPDLIFVCDFGQILSQRTLSGSILGGINLHGSLLPKFRGAAPVHWAILTGERETGVSIIHMTPQIDAGPVIAQCPPIPIDPCETVVELEERLAEYGAPLVLDTVSRMACSEPGSEPLRIINQLHDRVSKAPRLTKENGFVPWNRSSREIFNHYRAMIPWPRSFTDWHRADGEAVRLIFGKMTPLDDSFAELVHENLSRVAFVTPALTDAKMSNLANLKAAKKNVPAKSRSQRSLRPAGWKPGVVVRAKENELIIAAGEGTVRIEQIQPAGKKMMPIRDFLCGYAIKQGDKLGNEE